MKTGIKKFVALAAAVTVTASVAIGGTMAYYQDSASDVNVMTLGNVDIEQNEQERADVTKLPTADNNLVDFKQAKPLYPAVFEGTSIPWNQESEANQAWKVVEDNSNVVDKFVTVTNTGKSDAYVRTIIAYEGDDTYGPLGDYIHVVHNTTNVDPAISCEWVHDVVINDVTYTVGVYTYPAALVPEATTVPSLKQVYMNKAATNEVAAAYGDTYDILVLSQAVQTNGFTDASSALNEAFGAASKENVQDWFAGIVVPKGFSVSNSEELAAAVAAGETEIWLNPGEYTAPVAAQGKTLTINGTKDAILKVVPAGQGEANGQLDYSFDGSTVTFNGITIKTNSQLYAGYARLSGTYNDCVIQNTYNLGTGNSAFYNCEINITNEYLRVGGATSAIFDGCTFNTDGRAILVFQDGTNVAQTVTVKDCTFNATAAANTWNGIHVAAVSIDGTNGTYVVNLEGTNTFDADFNGLWQIKAGEANVTVNE